MTKTKAERKRQDAIAQLEYKIHFCRRKADYVGVIKYQQELNRLKQEANRLKQAEQERIQTTLLDCLSDRTLEERNEATTRVIYAIATADLLYGATMEVEEYLRKEFGIVDIPLMDHLRDIVEQLRKVVKSIDDVGCAIFSEHYADVVDEVETKYEATMKNYILNRLLKASRTPSKKGV